MGGGRRRRRREGVAGLFSPSPVSQPGVQLANFSVADISEPFSRPFCRLLPSSLPPSLPLSLRISVSRYSSEGVLKRVADSGFR